MDITATKTAYPGLLSKFIGWLAIYYAMGHLVNQRAQTKPAIDAYTKPA